MKTGTPFLLVLLLLNLSSFTPGQAADPLDTWQVVARPSVSIRGLAYKEGHFVAVGATTNILVSTNGRDWFLAASGLTGFFDGLLAVAESAGQFVAVGFGGTILSSPDGRQWTRRRVGGPASYEEFWAITHGNGLFVAVGYQNPGGAITATSTDGIHWEKFAPPINTTPRNVAYGQGLFVAAGAPVSMYSVNGRDWTPLPGVLAQGIAYGGGQFIATTGATGYQSSNGVDWTAIALPTLGADYVNYYTASYDNGTFIIGGFCDTCPNAGRPSLLATSTDGRKWTSRLFGADASIGAIRDIVFADGAFYLGDQSGKIWRSSRVTPVSPPVIRQVTQSGGQTSLSFTTVPGFRYAVECAERLDAAVWRPCAGPYFAHDTQLTASDPAATPPARFYRVRVE